MDFANLKIRVDSKDLDTAVKSLDKFEAHVKRTVPATQALLKQALQAGKLQIDTSGLTKAAADVKAFHRVVEAMKRDVLIASQTLGAMGIRMVNTANVAQKTGRQFQRTSGNVSALAKSAVLIQGPLGGVAARMITVNTVVRDFDAVAAAGILTFSGLSSIMGTAGISAVLMADKFTMLQARTKVMVGEMGNATATFQNIITIAAKTGSSVEVVSDVFNRISLGARELGKSNAQITKTVELVSELGVVSGASQANQQAGLLQFGQALGQGIVRAEEWNSIMENITALGQEIAAGLGKSTSEVRKMVIDGKLLAKDVFEALEKRTLFIEAKFAQMPRTISKSVNELKVEWFRVSAEIEAVIQKQPQIIAGVQNVTKLVKELGALLRDNLALLSGFAAASGIAAIVAVVQKGVVAFNAYMIAARAATAPTLALAGAGPVAAAGVTTLEVAINALKGAMGGVAIVAATVAAGFAIGSYLQYREQVDAAKVSTDQLRASLDKITEVNLAQYDTTIKTSKAYDELVKKGDKNKETQNALDYALKNTAETFGVSIERVMKMAKETGSLTEATYKLIDAQEQQRRLEELTKRKKAAEDAAGSLGGVIDRALPEVARDLAWLGESLDPFATTIDRTSSKYWEMERQGKINEFRELQKLIQELDNEYKKTADPKFLIELKKAREALNKLNTTPTSPAEDPRTKKQINDLEKLKRELALDLAQVQGELNLLNTKGLDIYLSQKNVLENIHDIKKKNLGISAQEEQALANQKTAIDMEKSRLDLRQKVLKVEKEVQDSKDLATARDTSIFAYNKLRLEQGVEAEFGPKIRMAYPDDTESQNAMLKAMQAQAKIMALKSNVNTIATLREEVDAQKKLLEAYAKGSEAVRQLTIDTETLNVAKQFSVVSSKQLAEIEELQAEKASLNDQKHIMGLNEKVNLYNKTNELSRTGWEWDEVYGERRNKNMEKELMFLQLKAQYLRDNLNLTDEQIRKEVDLQIAIDEQSKYIDLQKQRYDNLANTLSNFGDQFVDSFTQALQTGEFNFKKFATSILADIARIIIRAEVISRLFGGRTLMGVTKEGLLMKVIGGATGALTGGPAGAALGAAGVVGGSFPRFADGGVADSGPITGTFGERGAEAILPLTRLNNGKLGVMASGGSGVVQNNQINVNITGGAGNEQQNDDLVRKLTPVLQRELRGMVTGELLEQQRKGNTLNPGFSV